MQISGTMVCYMYLHFTTFQQTGNMALDISYVTFRQYSTPFQLGHDKWQPIGALPCRWMLLCQAENVQFSLQSVRLYENREHNVILRLVLKIQLVYCDCHWHFTADWCHMELGILANTTWTNADLTINEILWYSFQDDVFLEHSRFPCCVWNWHIWNHSYIALWTLN